MGYVSSFNRYLMISFFVGLILISITGCKNSFHKEPKKVAKKEVSGVIGLEGEDGNAKLQVILVSTTWCIECKKEISHILSYIKENNPSDLNVLYSFKSLIYNDSDEYDVEALKSWQKETNIPWPVEFDKEAPDSIAENVCPVLQFPCTIIIHPENGIILKKNGLIAPDLLFNFIQENL